MVALVEVVGLADVAPTVDEDIVPVDEDRCGTHPPIPGSTAPQLHLTAYRCGLWAADLVFSQPAPWLGVRVSCDIVAEDVTVLQDAGMSDADIVRLCELVAFLAYQTRVIDGLRLMQDFTA